MKNNKGFTLIELLAVILILGIIALIAIPTVNGVIEQSRKGAAESTGNELVKALEQWHTICLIEDSTGAKCDGDFKDNTDPEKHTDLDSDEQVTGTDSLKSVLGIKGDVPEYDDISQIELTTTGEAKVTYVDGNYTCTNLDDDGNILSTGVECTKK